MTSVTNPPSLEMGAKDDAGSKFPGNEGIAE